MANIWLGHHPKGIRRMPADLSARLSGAGSGGADSDCVVTFDLDAKATESPSRLAAGVDTSSKGANGGGGGGGGGGSSSYPVDNGDCRSQSMLTINLPSAAQFSKASCPGGTFVVDAAARVGEPPRASKKQKV